MSFFESSTLLIVGQGALWLGVGLAFASVPSVLQSRRGTPLAALSWLFALMLFPWLGAICWWLFGRKALRRRRRKRAAKRAEFLRRRGQDHAIQVPHETVRQAQLAVSASAENYFCAPSQVQVLCEGPGAFERIASAISEAKSTISVLYYIWADDRVGVDLRDRLIERAKAGVKVRVLLDAIGSFELHRNFWDALEQAGGEVVSFMPPRLWTLRQLSLNFRNHRKILVIDHDIAFTGGMNVAESYATVWQDVHMQTRGEAARALEEIFYEDWFYATGQFLEAPPPGQAQQQGEDQDRCPVTVVSSGPDSPIPWIHDHYFRAMASAQKRLWIATPYFLPTESIRTALRIAALRRLDVRVLVPGKSDQRLVQWASRAYYPGLVTAGVKIYEYQPTMMHAKVWLADRDQSSVGSANLDPRSFRLNFEVTCMIQSESVTQTLSEWFEKMFAQSTLIEESALAQTPRWQILRDSLAHLWTPLL